MDLNSILVSEFAKITNDNKETVNEGTTVYGTYRVDGDGAYVQIDGSDTRTPVATTTGAKSGDRVTVLIKNHRAIVTGNLTDPSATTETVKELDKKLDLGLGGIDDVIKDVNDIERIVDPGNWKYTDSEGNIKTLSGKLGDMDLQFTGMAASIEGAEKVATNFIEFVNPYGLIIGDLTGGTLGFNTLIDATSLNMRYNSTVLAKYTSNAIYLGYNSTSSKISMCGDSLVMSTGPYDANTTESMIISNLDIMEIGIKSGPGIRFGASAFGDIDVLGTMYAGTIIVNELINDQWDSYLTSSEASLAYYGEGSIMVCQSIRPSTDGIKACGLSDYRWSNVYCTKSEINTSDKNMKKNIEPISEKYINMFDLLTPVSYKWIDGDRTHIGFISQDIEEKMTEVGLTDLDFGGFCKDLIEDKDGNITERYGLRYSEFIGIMAAKIKQLESRIESLENKEVL